MNGWIDDGWNGFDGWMNGLGGWIDRSLVQRGGWVGWMNEGMDWTGLVERWMDGLGG